MTITRDRADKAAGLIRDLSLQGERMANRGR